MPSTLPWHCALGVIPVSRSAEQLLRLCFPSVGAILTATHMTNGEPAVRPNSVVAHETETGHVQRFREEADSPGARPVDLEATEFALAIRDRWCAPNLFAGIQRRERRSNLLVNIPATRGFPDALSVE